MAAMELLDGFGFPVNDAQVRAGLLKVFWPGRLESFCLSKADGSQVDCSSANALHYLLDGAHNPAGVATLVEALRNDYAYDRLILVWAAMSDKDFRKPLPQICSLAHVVIFTRLAYDRSAQPDQLRDALPVKLQERVLCENSIQAALAKAAELAGENDLICIAGSLYLIGEARKALKGEII
jgi:dihydrofolate synthase/folylpolyglutamate synthase